MTNRDNNVIDSLTALEIMERIADGESLEQATRNALAVKAAVAQPHETDGMSTAEYCAWVRNYCDRVRRAH